MNSQTLNEQQKIFWMVAHALEGDAASSWFEFCSTTDESILKAEQERLKDLPEEEKRKQALSGIKILNSQAGISLFSQIHPDWIADALGKESSIMAAAILRLLPSEKADAVLEVLSQQTDLPLLSQVFSVDPKLIWILKTRFEDTLVPQDVPLQNKNAFDSLHLLPLNRLRQLFYKVGLREMALAFKTLNEKTIEVILNRLNPQDAVKLKQEMNAQAPLVTERLKKAQSHLMAMNLQKGDPSLLFQNLGMFVYSKAITQVNESALKFMMIKFPKKEGEMLVNYVEKNVSLNQNDSAQQYRTEIMMFLY